jgi:hypothetical protein
MSLDRQVTCGIEFPVYISVEKILGFPAGHKQFSGVVFVTSKMWQNCVIESGQWFSSANRFASTVRHHCYKPREVQFYFRTRQLFSRARASLKYKPNRQ